MAKVLELSTDDVIVLPDYATRVGEPDEDGVKKIAESFIQRHTGGIEPVQIEDGTVVLISEGKFKGKYGLIDGRYRLEAVKLVNDAGGLDGEPMMFTAKAVRGGDDEKALVTGIQANFHNPTTPMDRAESAAKLVALGKKNNEIARILGVSEATVTQLLKLKELPKKYQKAITDGDIDQDAAILLGDLDATDTQRQEIFESCLKHKERLDSIMAKREEKAAAKELAERITDAKAREEELRVKAKETEKAQREAEKLVAKANADDLPAAREAFDAAKKAHKEAGKEWSAAAKDLDKAKNEKAKVAEKRKAKASAEDVRSAAKEAGVTKTKGGTGKGKSKEGKAIGGSPISKQKFIAELEAMSEDAKNPLPKSACELIGKLEGFLEGDYSVSQMRNSFIKWCVPDGK